MITGNHAVIRTTDSDDAPFLQRLYADWPPRSSLLDRKRELIVPTADELRELLGRKDNPATALLAVEDLTGTVRGFCGLRQAGPELAYGELLLMLFDELHYREPLALETFAYLCKNAFAEKRLNKLLAHCLDTEPEWRGFLTGRGFTCDGKQRDVFFTRGEWHDLESFSLLRGAV
ncbi:MAG: GNAT family N-acetyltransferase [Candidatus Hydrogenedentes bacterium]|nr:GNAT family N-acetyltransferase [Candidatus Hydrogenedentota bacterium]